MERGPYDVGLDIGTNSLGWAVVGENGELAKFKGKHLWGTVLIQQAGQTAESRRLFRSSRRRISRKKQRIQWIQELLGPLVLPEDPNFFERLKYSYLSTEDDSYNIDMKSILGSFLPNENQFHLQYPTIYHLRKSLVESKEKFDIRLVYLAIHHIVKYRGNFLYPGQRIEVRNLDITGTVEEMLVELGLEDENDEVDSGLCEKIAEILKLKKRKGEKKDSFVDILMQYAPENIEKPKDWAKAVASLILGYKANVSLLWGGEEKTDITFSDDGYLKIEETLDDDQVLILDSIQKVYSAGVLQSILSGEVSTLSDAYINRYEAHKEDLFKLKALLNKYSPDNYQELINGDNGRSYADYITSTKKCNREKLCGEIRKLLEKMPQDDEDVHFCLEKIENEKFLLKPRNSENGAIPNQLHVEELSRIIDGQAKFHSELSNVKQKLLSIASFRIPYYVGPLSGAASPYAWAVRKEEGKIYPWNIFDKIDRDKTAEEFIRRLANKCTYLFSEDVLPKNSILLSRFNVLNEMANIKVDGQRLSPECKLKALEDLFTENKKVSKKTFISWLKSNDYIPRKNVDVSGFSDENGFVSSLSAYIDFKKIFGTLDGGFGELAEMIVEWITIFEDKEILEKKVKEVLSQFPGISEAQKSAILKLRYSGWGRLSKKLLTGIYSKTPDGSPVSILQLMEATSMNFMEILYDKDYDFLEMIDDENLKNENTRNLSKKELIMSYPGSPALKKATWVSVRVLEEIAKIMGGPARSIYVEVAAGDGEKKRTESRYSQLEKKYLKIKEGTGFDDTLRILREKFKKDPKKLDSRRLMLYFLQNGKCLYSGETLDIDNLMQYQVDHILPQCYIKDDSFDNLALVLQSENQRKRDSLLLEEHIINRQKPMWEQHLHYGLMSRKKFDNLSRTTVNENDAEKFINRQLVETRQISKNVILAIESIYGKNVVFGLSAKLSSNLRKRMGLEKVREVNDFHHAQDALLAAKAGFFVQKRFSVMPSSSREWYSNVLQNNDRGRTERHGLLAALFIKGYVKDWNGYMEAEQIRKWFGYHDYFINCLTEESTSMFYDQTLKSKDGNPEKLIPKKKGLKPELYGGYTGEQDAYFCIIEYLKGKKRDTRLVGIPIRIAVQENTDPDVVLNYLEPKYKQARILKNRILKYQHILYHDGEKVDDFYIVGADEVISARQLILSQKSYRLVCDIMANVSQKNISDIEIETLYSELCEKMMLYPCFRNIADSCMKLEDAFMELPFLEKKDHIRKMLVVMQSNSSRVENADWKLVNSSNELGIKIPGSRLGKTLQPEKIEFIYSSITGVFVNKEKMWGSEQ